MSQKLTLNVFFGGGLETLWLRPHAEAHSRCCSRDTILKSALLKIAVLLTGCQPSKYEGNQLHCCAREVRKCERVGLSTNLISAEIHEPIFLFSQVICV